MLKKINRALKRVDFVNSREDGVVFQSPLFGVSVVNNKNEDIFRTQIGFVISRKIDKKAVVRNKIKRYLAEAVRKNIAEWEDKNYKIIFLVKKNILEKTEEEIEFEVVNIFKKINEKHNLKHTEVL